MRAVREQQFPNLEAVIVSESYLHFFLFHHPNIFNHQETTLKKRRRTS